MLKGAAIKAGRVYDRCPSTIIDGALILLAIAAGFAFAVYVVGGPRGRSPNRAQQALMAPAWWGRE
jgi:hypothetical protein